jgi:glycine/D-amino acid oxidase-like deaminating enzyme
MLGFERWMTEARGHGLDVRLQSSGQVYDRYPTAAVQWVGGLFTESDGHAEPWVAVPLLAAGAVRRGAVIVEDCAVRRLDLAAGRVVGVVTEQGTIACDQVVVAGGGVVVPVPAGRGGELAPIVSAGLGRADCADGGGDAGLHGG